MSSLLCRLCYVQCRTQFFHVDIFLFPVSMSHAYFRFEVICKVTFWLKGHFSVILSEGASVCRKGCGVEWSVAWQEKWVWQIKCDCRKGFGLSPKEDKSGLGCGKEVESSLTPPVDGSGEWSEAWQGWLVWRWPSPSWTTVSWVVANIGAVRNVNVVHSIFDPCSGLIT
jgi:hypothetical protein